jgi:hypothetical protein
MFGSLGFPSRNRRIVSALLTALVLTACLAAVVGLLASCSFSLDYDKYAIVYGISDYPDPINDLTVADDDAMAMRDLLEDQGFEVDWEINDQANLSNLADDLVNPASGYFYDIMTVATIDDLFVFYFSGHGGYKDLAGGSENTPGSDADQEYIALYNYELTDDELAQLLRSIPCARKVVILDSCFSGGFISNALAADSIPPEYYDDPNGFFGTLGDAIYLESATKADYNFDGYITVSESYFYIYKNIDEHFNKLYGASGYAFFPHTSGGPVDYILFVK